MIFSRLSNLFRGFMSLFVSGLEKRNPEALLEIERENLRTQIAQYNQGLAAHAGMAERLITQVKRLEQQEQELRARTSANLRAGNKELAGQLALQLQTVSRELAENRQQATQADETYKNLIKARDVSIKAAKDKIEKLRFALSDLKVKKATAELSEMASGMISQIGGSGDTLDRLHTMVEEEREKAAGRARVAKDSIDMTSVQMKESEQNALAEQALADFAAKEGIALSGAAPVAETEGGAKSMGPVSQ
jgi:phage shock protein A